MQTAKKLIFAPFFLILLTIIFYQLPALFKTDLIFSFDQSLIILLGAVTVLIVVSTIFLVIFIALALDFKLVLPTILAAVGLPLIFMPFEAAIVLSLGLLGVFLTTYFKLWHLLKTYTDFRPTSLFTPVVKQSSFLFIVAISIVYFLIVNTEVQQKDFEIPDQLIETAIKFTQPQTPSVKGVSIAQAPGLTAEQIELLKKNPDLLRQNNIDPAILDSIVPLQNSTPGQPSSTTLQNPTSSAPPTIPQSKPGNINLSGLMDENLIKDLVKNQFDQLIKPYMDWVPLILTLLFFLTLQSLLAVVNIFVSPIIFIIFYIFEKSGFVKFQEEQRTVKKMVI